ncbi:DUF4214 domain-containing protein [Glaciihabitans sp. dw_435]|uniref:DUF4214 domain-containing protein n=1 Tax=Glaciihabitans sp. dw_435 TaxID=2720081 RepID=UPI001BD5AD82|nr:DUF4214 domain-containing protein [Glaciihabitans sp. dw_435]
MAAKYSTIRDDTGRMLRKLGSLTVAALTLGALIGSIALVSPFSAAPAQALDSSTFKSGQIISDEVMYYEDSMSASSIQTFISNKGGKCAAGFTCLASYRMNTTTKAADPMCGKYTGAKNESAATIIYKVAQACGVNPQVLIVTLQKEQGLVTATSPSALIYRKAMGYGCPDTSVCDSDYYGFFNQVYKAAWAYQRYTMPAGTGKGTPYNTIYNWFPVGKTTAIKLHPSSVSASAPVTVTPGQEVPEGSDISEPTLSTATPTPTATSTANPAASTAATCGYKSVTISNKATAALYYYTPYTPNKAALANLYGTGDACSSYGNRNFWRYFTDWFGSTVIPHATQAFVQALYQDVLGRPARESEIYSQSRTLQKMTNAKLATGFLTSTEYRTAYVKSVYLDIVGRPADKQGLANWVYKLQKGIVKQDDLPGLFMSSNEFFRKSGNTNAAYVTELYKRVLNRTPEITGLRNWVYKIQVGGRQGVTLSIWRSKENAKHRTSEAFVTYLGHGATPAQQNTWANRIVSTGYFAAVAQIIGSTEYVHRAQVRYPVIS